MIFFQRKGWGVHPQSYFPRSINFSDLIQISKSLLSISNTNPMVGQSRCSKIPSLHILSLYIACLKKDSIFRTSDFKNIGGGRVEPWVDRSRRLLSIYFVQVKYMYAFFFTYQLMEFYRWVWGGGVASVFFVSFLCKFLVWGRGFRTL